MTEQRYHAIADLLEHEISQLRPGTKLDSEHTLMKRFSVSRAAARASVQELERRLKVRRVQGSGTFVSNRIDYVISRDRRPSWHRTVRDAGGDPRSVILKQTLDPLPVHCANLLEVSEGTLAHHMIRLNFINGVVSGTGEEWISQEAVPHLADGMRVEESLDEVLRQMGHVRSVRSWCRTASDIPPPDIRERLQLISAVPAWVIESVNRDSDTGSPLTYSKAWMRADSVRVVMEIGAEPGRNSQTNNTKEEQ